MITHENKLGMFIHWGVYSMTGFHEQALARLNIDHSEYEALMYKFNPTAFDPDEWVLLAKNAGMKYICFTAKHHDGFCMWDTKQTDYSIMNTPYHKDVLKMLAEACERHGILLSIYYSNPDWHHPYGYNPLSTHQWKAKNMELVDTEKYREYIKAQITELLTEYGKIYTFFWDIPPKIQDPSMNELIRSLQPGIFINDRGWGEGDFSTPEREYQQISSPFFTRMTEACNSVGQQSWGYRKNEDFYSTRYLCSAIDRYMSMGASYLLNIGPNENGEITDAYKRKLLAVGAWYNRMEGCLESADIDSFDYRMSAKDVICNCKNGKTYLHFYKGLISEAIALRNYPSVPKSVRLMNTGKQLPYDIEYLPEAFAANSNCFDKKCLNIHGINIDELENEPIVVEIEWEKHLENV